MSHNVFANSNEICAKSSSGSSTLAADTCFSPGAPPPGVPILYMSTGKASDLTKGSKTVLIQGAEVCMQDKSYFSTNYGDESATKALKRGFVSTAVQGKCYFIGWSPNVSVQGKAVTRHMDMMTHNHSNPGNTPPMPFISSLDPDSADNCEGDAATAEKACEPAEGKSWVETHCDGMMEKPNGTEDEANAMTELANRNDCATARRCLLVPFSAAKDKDRMKRTGDGCCPGQTGHHVLPDAMFRKPGGGKTGTARDGKEKLSGWGNYTEGGAPVMCLEGVSHHNSHGSHGKMHEATETVLTVIQSDGGKNGDFLEIGDVIDALSAAIKAEHGCNSECIKAQLCGYFSTACSPVPAPPAEWIESKVVPHSGKPGGNIRPQLNSGGAKN